MNVEQEVLRTLRSVLGADERKLPLASGTALMGHVAELDSMAVVSILTALEERFGFTIDDDEVDGDTFATVGSLTRFVQEKLNQ